MASLRLFIAKLRAWIRIKGRSLEGLFFTLRRVTGVILVIFLVIHLIDISLLTQGDEVYDNFIKGFLTPQAIAFEGVVLFSLIYHGVTGIYVAIVGAGLLLSRRKELAIVLFFAGLLALIAGFSFLLSKVAGHG